MHHDIICYLDVRAVLSWVSKVISCLLRFCFTRLYDWLAKFAPFSQPMGSQPKKQGRQLSPLLNQNQSFLVARVFPRLTQVTCICFKFWLADCVVYICCDWPEKLRWFWFYNTQLKTALRAWNYIVEVSLATSCNQRLQRAFEMPIWGTTIWRHSKWRRKDERYIHRTKKMCWYAQDTHMTTQAHQQINMRLLPRTSTYTNETVSMSTLLSSRNVNLQINQP